MGSVIVLESMGMERGFFFLERTSREQKLPLAAHSYSFPYRNWN